MITSKDIQCCMRRLWGDGREGGRNLVQLQPHFLYRVVRARVLMQLIRTSLIIRALYSFTTRMYFISIVRVGSGTNRLHPSNEATALISHTFLAEKPIFKLTVFSATIYSKRFCNLNFTIILLSSLTFA